MDCSITYLQYEQTGWFSPLVTDYLSRNEKLSPFYSHPPTIQGIRDAITDRKKHRTDRELLVRVLRRQYAGLSLSSLQEQHLASLLGNNTFTITTAHQPNIFTGPLYFIYKIFHAIRLADDLSRQDPEHHFVPVYYMGSEDADLDELGHVHIGGEKWSWQTAQTGAVGRMKVDDAFISLIGSISGYIGVQPDGEQLINLFRACYTKGKTIQQATLELVHSLFAEYGLLVLIPDDHELKGAFREITRRELLDGFSQRELSVVAAKLGSHYKVQTTGRSINLFYLHNDRRERIELTGKRYVVNDTDISFTADEILAELEAHPERFSPNVVLRGVFQGTILPDVAFIGGGGELAYWMELGSVFAAAGIPYPVLVLRNSFLLVSKEQQKKMKKLGISAESIFGESASLVNELVRRESGVRLHLNGELEQVKNNYVRIGQIAGQIDATLAQHTAALEAKAAKQLAALEKKMLRAEKRKFSAQQQQVLKLKEELFPLNNLQERIDNFSSYYAAGGRDWMNMIFDASRGLDQAFCIIMC